MKYLHDIIIAILDFVDRNLYGMVTVFLFFLYLYGLVVVKGFWMTLLCFIIFPMAWVEALAALATYFHLPV